MKAQSTPHLVLMYTCCKPPPIENYNKTLLGFVQIQFSSVLHASQFLQL